MNLSLVALQEIESAVSNVPYWAEYLSPLFQGRRVDFNLHLAVFVEPYLGFLLEGSKTVESRFSVNRCAPFGRVRKGDVILLKKTGGAVVGLCLATYVWNYDLEEGSLIEIRDRFGDAICAQGQDFWAVRERATVATLIKVERAHSIEPVIIPKRDRRGWVVLNHTQAKETVLL